MENKKLKYKVEIYDFVEKRWDIMQYNKPFSGEKKWDAIYDNKQEATQLRDLAVELSGKNIKARIKIIKL